MEIAGKDKTIKEVYLHVQTSNEAARKFYLERHQFEEVGIAKGYYKHIEPADGYILRRELQ
jgi:N-alpha-acetyltransferase 50